MDDGERMTTVRAEQEQEREEHRQRVLDLLPRLPTPSEDSIVYDASEPGVRLIEVIEATADLSNSGPWPEGRMISPADAYVRLPRGYATVEFLRMVFAVSG